eukprot:991444-Rhodomonas_salina.1
MKELGGGGEVEARGGDCHSLVRTASHREGTQRVAQCEIKRKKPHLWYKEIEIVYAICLCPGHLPMLSAYAVMGTDVGATITGISSSRSSLDLSPSFSLPLFLPRSPDSPVHTALLIVLCTAPPSLPLVIRPIYHTGSESARHKLNS